MTAAARLAPPVMPPPFPPGCRLVVFDLDGTLYRQAAVRRGMALRLAAAALRPSADGLGAIERVRLLARIRREREALAEAAPEGFEAVLHARLARVPVRAPGWGEEASHALAAEWLEFRPLPLLRGARVRGAGRLLAALRARGVATAVWSDHPVRAKLAALGLEPDHAISAHDPELGTLKPHPRGLALALARAGCPPGAALMVGDRPDRDGAAAAALGVAFLRRGPGGVADFRPLLRALGEPV